MPTPDPQGDPNDPFSAALCRGLIEAMPPAPAPRVRHRGFSAALCRGLIEAGGSSAGSCRRGLRFPRLYAAASLKRRQPRVGERAPARFSAALCRGLIEASRSSKACIVSRPRFPRLYAAASLKQGAGRGAGQAQELFSAALCRGLIEARYRRRARQRLPEVFRGFMPRPH